MYSNVDERKFLLERNLDDVCINKRQVDHWKKHKEYLYVSDTLAEYKRIILLQRTTAYIWLRLSAFTQIIKKITSYICCCTKLRG